MSSHRNLIASALIASLVLGAGPVTAAPTAGPVTTIHSFDPSKGEYLEGLAIDTEGNVYVGIPFLGEIWKFTPDGTPSVFTTVDVGNNGGIIVGLAVDHAGDLYVCDASGVEGSHGIWKIDRHGTPTLFAALPPQTNPFTGFTGFGFPNGLAFDDKGNLYVTDSFLAAVWKITGTGKASIWIQDQLLNYGCCMFGANGVEFDRGSMFVSNTDLGSIVRIRMSEQDRPRRAEVFVQDPTLVGADGIAFDEAHNLYVAVDRQNTLIRISTEGVMSTLGTAADGLDYPASTSFDQRRGTRATLYFTNAGLIFNTPTLQKVDVGVRGEPLP